MTTIERTVKRMPKITGPEYSVKEILEMVADAANHTLSLANRKDFIEAVNEKISKTPFRYILTADGIKIIDRRYQKNSP
jgi:hypothetical protein